MSMRIKNISAQLDQFFEIKQDCSNLSNATYHIVERTNKKITSNYDFDFSGILHTTKVNLHRSELPKEVLILERINKKKSAINLTNILNYLKKIYSENVLKISISLTIPILREFFALE